VKLKRIPSSLWDYTLGAKLAIILKIKSYFYYYSKRWVSKLKCLKNSWIRNL